MPKYMRRDAALDAFPDGPSLHDELKGERRWPPAATAQSRVAFFCVPTSARRTSSRIYRAFLRVEKKQPRSQDLGPPVGQCNTYTLLHVTVITGQHVIGRLLRLGGGLYDKLAMIAKLLEPALNVVG